MGGGVGIKQDRADIKVEMLNLTGMFEGVRQIFHETEEMSGLVRALEVQKRLKAAGYSPLKVQFWDEEKNDWSSPPFVIS